MTPDEWAQRVRSVVARTCEEQGVPVVLTDAAALDRLAVLLSGTDAGRRAQTRSVRTSPAPAGSEAPHGLDPLDGDGSGTLDPRVDHDVVDQSLDDGALAVEVQVGPLSA